MSLLLDALKRVERKQSDSLVSPPFLSGADGVFLNVALGKARRRSVKGCVARRQASGVPVCGSVLIGP